MTKGRTYRRVAGSGTLGERVRVVHEPRPVVGPLGSSLLMGTVEYLAGPLEGRTAHWAKRYHDENFEAEPGPDPVFQRAREYREKHRGILDRLA